MRRGGGKQMLMTNHCAKLCCRLYRRGPTAAAATTGVGVGGSGVAGGGPFR